MKTFEGWSSLKALPWNSQWNLRLRSFNEVSILKLLHVLLHVFAPHSESCSKEVTFYFCYLITNYCDWDKGWRYIYFNSFCFPPKFLLYLSFTYTSSSHTIQTLLGKWARLWCIMMNFNFIAHRTIPRTVFISIWTLSKKLIQFIYLFLIYGGGTAFILGCREKTKCDNIWEWV